MGAWYEDVGHRLMVKTVLFGVLLLVIWYNGHNGINAQAKEGQIAHHALCVFKEDLQARHDTTIKYLEDNPGDFVLGNVPRQTLVTSADNQQKTIDLLAELEC